MILLFADPASCEAAVSVPFVLLATPLCVGWLEACMGAALSPAAFFEAPAGTSGAARVGIGPDSWLPAALL